MGKETRGREGGHWKHCAATVAVVGVGRHGRGHPGQLLRGAFGRAVAQDAVDARHARGGAVYTCFCVETLIINYNTLQVYCVLNQTYCQR